MKTTNWIGWLTIGGIALAGLRLGAGLLTPLLLGGVRGWSYNGCGWDGWGTMANWGGPGMMGFSPFGWLGMLIGGLFPLGLFVLLVAGGVWLVQTLTHNSVPLTAAGP